MQSADKAKAGERALATSILSVGVASVLAALISEPVGAVFYVLFGLGCIVSVILKIHQRVIQYFSAQKSGSIMISIISIFSPLLGFLLFGFYAGAIGTGLIIGVPFETSIQTIAFGSALLAVANLVLLIINIVSLLKRPEAHRR